MMGGCTRYSRFPNGCFSCSIREESFGKGESLRGETNLVGFHKMSLGVGKTLLELKNRKNLKKNRNRTTLGSATLDKKIECNFMLRTNRRHSGESGESC